MSATNRPKKKAGRPYKPGAFRNPLPLRINDKQLLHLENAVSEGRAASMNELVRLLIDADMEKEGISAENST